MMPVRNGVLDRSLSLGALLSVFCELLANNTPEGIRETIITPIHILSQRIVDQGLVVPPTRRVNLLAKPLQDVVVNSDGNAGLPGGA
jgi:hypothetical protein